MIIKATKKDIPAIIKLAKSTKFFSRKEIACLLEDCKELVKPNSEDYIVVHKNNNSVLGFAIYGKAPITDRSWFLYWIAVDKKSQGFGIGKALLNYVENKVRQKKGRMLFVETSSKDEYAPTRRFYDNNNYLDSCLIPCYYSDADDKVIYSKHL